MTFHAMSFLIGLASGMIGFIGGGLLMNWYLNSHWPFDHDKYGCEDENCEICYLLNNQDVEP